MVIITHLLELKCWTQFTPIVKDNAKNKLEHGKPSWYARPNPEDRINRKPKDQKKWPKDRINRKPKDRIIANITPYISPYYLPIISQFYSNCIVNFSLFQLTRRDILSRYYTTFFRSSRFGLMVKKFSPLVFI